MNWIETKTALNPDEPFVLENNYNFHTCKYISDAWESSWRDRVLARTKLIENRLTRDKIHAYLLLILAVVSRQGLQNLSGRLQVNYKRPDALNSQNTLHNSPTCTSYNRSSKIDSDLSSFNYVLKLCQSISGTRLDAHKERFWVRCFCLPVDIISMLNPTGSNACKLSRLPSPVYTLACIQIYVYRTELIWQPTPPPKQRADLHECPSSFDYLSDLTIASRYYCSDDGFQYNETINKISCVWRHYYWVSFSVARHATINGISISHVAQNWKFPECKTWFHGTDLYLYFTNTCKLWTPANQGGVFFQTRAKEKLTIAFIRGVFAQVVQWHEWKIGPQSNSLLIIRTR